MALYIASFCVFVESDVQFENSTTIAVAREVSHVRSRSRKGAGKAGQWKDRELYVRCVCKYLGVFVVRVCVCTHT